MADPLGVLRRILLLSALVGTVALANWLVSAYGLVGAGFGLLVPAGTYAAGLALGLRDALHDAGGVRWVFAGIAAGAALSLLVADGRVALASGAAFLVSELADLAAYAPLRQRHRYLSVLASNAVGAPVDTALFLTLAGFGLSWPAVGGQLLVKVLYCTAAYLAVREVVRRGALPRQRVQPDGA